MKQPLIILTGPTAVGKTELSILLAKQLNSEIISADSMQVYRSMDIGSAKIKPEEMQGIPHHLVDLLDPKESFDVFLFQKMAKEAIGKIRRNGKIPLMVGGTGFYIQSVLYDIDFKENDHQKKLREHFEQMMVERGPHEMHEMLKEIDYESYEKIHENNQKRVIRALEFFHETGKKISEHNEEEHRKESRYQSCYFVLNDERDIIYQNINRRVDEMVANGLIEEVKKLQEMGCTKDMVSMQGLGYKEILSYLNGEISLSDAIYIIKRDTRHFAKRQLTWFRREKDVIWINKQDFQYDKQRILSYMLDKIREEGLEI